MTITRINPGRIAVMITVPALLATAFGGAVAAQDDAEPVQVCELAYYTGGFAAYGPSLTNDVRFVIDEVINSDPPLQRPWELISEDIGDTLEGQAAESGWVGHSEITAQGDYVYIVERDNQICNAARLKAL